MNNFEHLLKLVDSKRWFFFKNSEHTLFDKKSSLFWIDPYYIFPEKLTIEEAQKKASSITIENLSDWRVATSTDLDDILVAGFPFYETYKNMREGDWDFENDFDKILFIPCYDKFSNFNLENSERVLHFFTENNLFPDFGDLKSEEQFLMFRRFSEKKGILKVEKIDSNLLYSKFLNSGKEYFKNSLELLNFVKLEIKKHHKKHSFLDSIDNFINYIKSQESELLNITSPEMLIEFQKRERVDFNYLLEWSMKNFEHLMNKDF